MELNFFTLYSELMIFQTNFQVGKNHFFQILKKVPEFVYQKASQYESSIS